MCGIAGVVLRGGETPDRGGVTAMTDALAHRGPDGEGSFLGPGVGLGHRRLAIVDLSSASAQPMVGARRTVLTFNGEVYNWRALRDELAALGHVAHTTGDTEVLLMALEAWGLGALARVEGMFAFGHWDPAERALVLARDRFGEKPLYYAPLGEDGRGGVVFASELRALLQHPSVREGRAIDPAAVAQFFLHEFVPAPRSILANVKKLPAGHLLRWTDGGKAVVEPYYAPRYRGRRTEGRFGLSALRPGEGDALANELTRQTVESVRARLVADVPVGVFLSGGLDSSFLAACAAHVHPRVRTFTVRFDDPSFDESEHARLVARHLGTEHVEYRLSEQALLELVPSTLDWMDEPFADSSLLPTTLLAREVRRAVTVALGGEGGDELLAGYPTFVVDQVASRLPGAPPSVASLARRAAARVPSDSRNFSLSFTARQLAQGVGESGARRHAAWLAPLLPEDLRAFAGPRLDAAARAHAYDAADRSVPRSATPFDVATAFYLGVYLGEGVLTKVDRATMRASLEARAPLLDSGLVDFCLGLPPGVCLRGTTTKWIMRQALRGMVPRSITRRPKKGFGAPVGAWLRGPLRSLLEDTLSPRRLRDGGWLDPVAIGDAVREHVSGERDHRKLLHAALVFEHWRQRAEG